MSTNKSCTNCPGATDHDTAHCPLRVIRLGSLDPEQRLALARGPHPEQAEGAQGEREAFEAYRDRRNALLESEGHKPGSKWHVTQAHSPTWEAARAALAQPSNLHSHDAGNNQLGERWIDGPATVFGYKTHGDAGGALVGMAQPSPKCATCCDQGEVFVSNGKVEPHMLEEPEPIYARCPDCAQPSPAPELERPEVAAWVQPISGMNEFFRTEAEANAERAQYLSSFEPEPEDLELKPEALIRLADFDRIVGALRADIGFQIGMALAKKESEFQDFIDEHWRPIAAERDAAQARVAELEKQEPVGTVADLFFVAHVGKSAEIRLSADVKVGAKLYAAPVAQAGQLHELDKQCRDDVARALGLTPQGDGYAWSALLADIKTAAKVSQAGQVPDGWTLVPEDATLEMVEALKAELVTTNKGGILRAGIALNAAIAAAPAQGE